MTIFCIATYRKGDEFLRECRTQGWRVLLLTDETLRDADWPREAIDEFYYVNRGMPDADIRKGMAHVARTERIDRLVALDDFDVETAAMLREYLAMPGMGQTTARAFRDKLTMRTRAREAGIPCPEFVHVLNDEAIRRWTARIPAPWVLKPRSQAAAIGIRKLPDAGELWSALDSLGDARGDYLLEAFLPGDVYHVDSLVIDGVPQFAIVSRYATPPMQVVHEGGIFVTCTLPDDAPESDALRQLNARVLGTFGLRRGVSHTEFIRGAAGWAFLETSARVGGAFIVDMIEAATGLNLWREWAKLEIADAARPYRLPSVERRHAGIVLSLARQESPDTRAYTAPEIVHRIRKRHHAGVILASTRAERIAELVDEHVRRFYDDFHATAPPPERATD